VIINLLRVPFRNLYKDGLYSILNLAGLAISFSCFLIIFLYLNSELSYDRHFQDHDRIYRLTSEWDIAGNRTRHARVGTQIGPLLAQDYAQFEDFGRLSPFSGNGMLVINNNVSVFWDIEEGFYGADNSIIDIFNLDVLSGNSETALTEPRSIAISESLAKVHFGDEDPVGQTLGIQSSANTYTVVLVFADLPRNTSHRFNMLFSNNQLTLSPPPEMYFELGIASPFSHTFFRLSAEYDPGNFHEISGEFFNRHVNERAQQVYSGQSPRLELQLQPLSAIHLSPALESDVPKGSPVTLYALFGIVVFILGVASINYMNLSTARFAKRAKEIGVRRTLGAGRRAVVGQFLIEGVWFSLLALLIGIVIAEVLFSTAIDRTLLGHDLSVFMGNDTSLLILLVLVGIAIGLISGAYPAFYFSVVKPVNLFRPIVKISGFGINLRSIFIGLQMLVSIGVIAGAMIMYQQVSFMKNRPLGFEKENKLVVKVNVIANGTDYRTVMTELSRHPDIFRVTMADEIPGTPAYGESVLMQDDNGQEINIFVETYNVDENYLETLSIPLVNGRSFPPGNRSLENSSIRPYLVNESLVNQMGWADPIGKEIVTPTDGTKGEVVGVFADYNFSSLHDDIRPQVIGFFYDNWRWQRYLVIDINPNKIQDILGYVETSLATLMPETPFDYSFLDETLNGLYADEQNQTLLALVGSVVCIVIAMLGLFGLIAFTIDQKTKEIGIRRVLGGSVARILAAMFKGIFALIIVAAIVASVMVFYALNIWLEGFAYRISINPMTFAVAMILVLMVSALTVAIQSIKVARDNPANSLRYK